MIYWAFVTLQAWTSAWSLKPYINVNDDYLVSVSKSSHNFILYIIAWNRSNRGEGVVYPLRQKNFYGFVKKNSGHWS